MAHQMSEQSTNTAPVAGAAPTATSSSAALRGGMRGLSYVQQQSVVTPRAGGGDEAEYAAFHGTLPGPLKDFVASQLRGVDLATVDEPVWSALEHRTGKTRSWLMGYAGWLGQGTTRTSAPSTGTSETSKAPDGTDNEEADEQGKQNTTFSQAAWYDTSGNFLTFDAAKKAAATLTKHAINEGGDQTATFVFNAAGAPLGLVEFGIKKTEWVVEYVNNKAVHGREDMWSFWFSQGKRDRFLEKEAMKTTGVPRFTSKPEGSTPVPDELVALDLAFIPGPASCVRTVRAMETASDDHESIDSGARGPFDPERRDEQLDVPLAAGNKVTLRVVHYSKKGERLEHQILLVGKVGDDQYLVDDPGRNPNGALETPRNTYTYKAGSLVREGGGKTYEIIQVEKL